MGIPAISGNTALLAALKNTVSRGALKHAYVISGPAGSGKSALSLYLTAAILCSASPEKRPCGVCAACRKASQHIHPDVMVTDFDEKEIPVGEIRSRLRPDVWIRPNDAQNKVFIIKHAQNMNVYAQNALLATLEEPPSYAYFLLLTENTDGLLPTVRSRCLELRMCAVDARDALPVLSSAFPDLSEDALIRALGDARGYIGGALSLLGEKPDQSAREDAERFMYALSSGDELALLNICLSYEKAGREQFEAFAACLAELAGGALTSLYGSDSSPSRQMAQKIGASSLERLYQLACAVQKALDYNVGVTHLCALLCAAACDPQHNAFLKVRNIS